MLGAREMWYISNFLKPSLEGFAGNLNIQKTELVRLKIGQLKLSSPQNRKSKKNEEKWTEPVVSVAHHQKGQYIHYGSPREKGAEKLSKETITENVPCLMKDMNLHMQEIQWTPSQRSTLRQTIIKLSRDKDKETWEKREGGNLPCTRAPQKD